MQRSQQAIQPQQAQQGVAHVNSTTTVSESAKVEKAIELLAELQSSCSSWFRRVRGGLQKPYDAASAHADQQKILELFSALQEELRRTGLESLFVDKGAPSASGGEGMPKLPKHVLRGEAGASANMVSELKGLIGQLTQELEGVHQVADRANRAMESPVAGVGSAAAGR